MILSYYWLITQPLVCLLSFYNSLLTDPFYCVLMQSDLVQSSAMSEFDLFVEGDLFKAPETIIEEPEMDLDQMQAAMSMMSGGEDMSSQGLKSSDIDDVLQSEQLLSEVYYDCKKDLLEKAAIESPLSEILEIKIPALNIDENSIQENKPIPDVLLSKSVSSGNLSSMDWMHAPAMKPAFLDFPGIDFNAVYGMRRAFSEGDIKVNLKQFMYFVCASYKLNNIYGHFVKHYMLYRKKSKSHVEKSL